MSSLIFIQKNFMRANGSKQIAYLMAIEICLTVWIVSMEEVAKTEGLAVDKMSKRKNKISPFK